jgi:hypothetical protein
LLLISKEKRNLEIKMRTETCEEKEHMHEDRGISPKEKTFSIDVKGGERETLMSNNGHRGSMSVSINVGVLINSKWGDCWTVGCH